MPKPIDKDSKGLVMVTGPTRSGKSELAEFLVSAQQRVSYIATSMNRENDSEWQKRIEIHRNRRSSHWKLLEPPIDICKYLSTLSEDESVLIDSIGGLVEEHIKDSSDKWDEYTNELVDSLCERKRLIVIVSEEVGWGIVPSTSLGHLFRERLSAISSCLAKRSIKKWLAIQGHAIDIEKIGFKIPK